MSRSSSRPLIPALAAAGALAAGIVVTGAATAAAAPGSMLPAPLPSIASLDVERYAGTWQQVAAVPQPFNLECARDTRATYAVTAPGTISVRNDCTTWSGAPSGITGEATVTDPSTNASLQVTFPSVPFSPPEGLPNYVVTYIDEGYETAIVGDPARTSGFVLSRSGTLTGAEWQQVQDVIVDRGWNPCFFLTSPITGGLETIQPLCTL
ncbi:lipocalin family protein [Hoyosella sp. G463]|uniref:Lipocalin family protein n=1 Tax=Lolliginicoccus lacisalsi TaxID=2742202 RepID=A0A927JF43_9ACTN|nr:lipocalin family protein [Lolliginicoccus lacisalsi]MBD8507647.1 lipocalin family protein [Lolliginicoccus lacisalsi]